MLNIIIHPCPKLKDGVNKPTLKFEARAQVNNYITQKQPAKNIPAIPQSEMLSQQ